jgi:hypothetical protein
MRTFLLLLLLLIPLGAYAQDFDVTEEPMPSINKARITKIVLMPTRNRASVRVEKGYEDEGVFVGTKTLVLYFEDIEDDLSTPVDETVTDYTDLIQASDIDPAALRVFIKSKVD